MRPILSLVLTSLVLSLACGGGAGTDPVGEPGASPRAAQAAAGSDDGAPPRGLPASAVRFEPTMIVDATGFQAPMAAATLFVPHGWQAQGGVFWGREAACTNGYVMNWRATSPDGLQSIAVLPQERWESNNYGAPPSTPGCSSAPYTDVRQYLEAVVQRVQPGARIIDFRPREDVRRDLVKLEQSVPMPAGESRTWVEAGEVRYTYADQGQEMQGSVACAAVFNLMRANYGMGPMDALTAFTFPTWSATAPAASFNPAFFEGIRRSIKTDPTWEAKINGHNNAIAQVALEESRKRSEILTRSNADIARIRQEAWDSYTESSDRRAREFGEALRGVNTYTDAAAPTGQVELSAQYGNAWRLNDGSYVLTDDAGFDPWRDLQVEGKRLDAAP